MLEKHHVLMRSRTLLIILISCFSNTAFAWGHDGHGAIGVLALRQVQADTRLALQNILGTTDDQTIVEACNWPDVVRKTDEWAWSAPLHYINIPKGESRYSEQRHCPDQLCATEAIKRYAEILGDEQTIQIERQQAFAWLCHLTGDLHQPLHAGFASDRGGNEFKIVFENEDMNLHGFWDRALITSRAGDLAGLLGVLDDYPVVESNHSWSPEQVNEWTEESHKLVEEEIYPPGPVISKSYQDKSWVIMQQRMTTAASRLAEILNTMLGRE